MSSATLGEWTTDVADPWTVYGYSDWRKNALAVRRQWMTMMGLDPEEVEEACKPGTSADLDEELANYQAMRTIKDINSQTRQSR